jgi:hypothetical protein
MMSSNEQSSSTTTAAAATPTTTTNDVIIMDVPSIITTSNTLVPIEPCSKEVASASSAGSSLSLSSLSVPIPIVDQAVSSMTVTTAAAEEGVIVVIEEEELKIKGLVGWDNNNVRMMTSIERRLLMFCLAMVILLSSLGIPLHT